MSNISLPRDNNRITVIGGVSSADGTTPVTIYVDPTTHRVLTQAASAALVVGTTTITNGSGTTNFLYDNNGVLAEGVPTSTITIGSAVSGGTASQLLATDGSTNLQNLTVATYPSLTELSYVKGVTSAIQTQLNAKGAGTVTAVSVATANGFSGSSSGGTTPALTIVAGAITPTSVNGNTITTGTGTLTLGAGKTLTANNSITLAGTDSTTMTFPSTSATVAGLGIAQSFTAANTFAKVIQTVTSMAAQALDGTLGNVFTRTLAASETFTQSGFTAGQCFIVEVKQGSGTSYTVTWFSGITWVTSGGTAPTQTTTTNGFTTYGFRCTGSNVFLGYLVGTQ